MSDATIDGANFNGSNLTGANLSGATYNDQTTFENTVRCNTTRADGSLDTDSCTEGGASTPPSSTPPTTAAGGGTTTTTAGGGGTTTTAGGGGQISCSAQAIGDAYNARGGSPQIAANQISLVGFACGGAGDAWAVGRLGSTSWVVQNESGRWAFKGQGTGEYCGGGIPQDLCTSLWGQIPT